MSNQPDPDFEPNENDIELLADTLRQCFSAKKARYHINDETLIIEISGLALLSENEISEIAKPILDELDPGFDEITLLDLNT